MDLNAIKAKLDTLNSNGQQKEKTDYSKIFWKLVTKLQIWYVC
jgi:hypothetical protein